MPKDQNRQKQVIMHKFTFLTHNPTFSCPCESLCCPVCDFKSEVEVVTHNGRFEPCWGNVTKLLHPSKPIFVSTFYKVSSMCFSSIGISCIASSQYFFILFSTPKIYLIILNSPCTAFPMQNF